MINDFTLYREEFSMKKLFQIISLCLCLSFCAGSVIPSFAVKTYCDTDTPTASSEESLGGLVDSATEALDSATEKAVKFARAACIVVMIICFLLLMFTKDSRKTGATISMIIIAAIAFIGIIAVNNGWIIKFLENIGNKYFGG